MVSDGMLATGGVEGEVSDVGELHKENAEC